MQSDMARQILRSVSWDLLVSYIALLDLVWPRVKPETSSKVVGKDIGAWCGCMGGVLSGVIEQTKSSLSGGG